MRTPNRPSMWSGFMTNNWSILFVLLGFLVFGIVVCFGYLLLQDNINAYIHTKKLSKEELIEINKKAEQRHIMAQSESDFDKVVDGYHVRTGLKYDASVYTVIKACTSCHSAKLISQNRATRSGWESMIRWMQATQGLQDLGKSEPAILDYLAKYYAPKETGRRANLDLAKVEWFILDLDE